MRYKVGLVDLPVVLIDDWCDDKLCAPISALLTFTMARVFAYIIICPGKQSTPFWNLGTKFMIWRWCLFVYLILLLDCCMVPDEVLHVCSC